jgi:limonene-1,2-epoxide hydrolase
LTEPTSAATASCPREVFDRLLHEFLKNSPDLAEDLWAEDVSVEMPFNPPGARRRIQGREEFIAFAKAGRASMPVRVEEVRNLVIHDTTDPEMILVEYELAATMITTNRHGSVPFVGVLKVKDGQIVLWREYQNVLAMADAMDQLPALLASMGAARTDPAPSGSHA